MISYRHGFTTTFYLKMTKEKTYEKNDDIKDLKTCAIFMALISALIRYQQGEIFLQ